MKSRTLLLSLSMVLAVMASTVVVPAQRVRANSAEPAVEYYYNAGRRVPVVRSVSRLAVIGLPASKADFLLTADPSVSSVRPIGETGVVELTMAESSSKAASGDLASRLERSGFTVAPV